MKTIPFKTPSSNESYKECPSQGQHTAVCVAVIDLGTHSERYTNTDKDGVESIRDTDVPMIAVFWEVVDCHKSSSTDHFVYGDKYNLKLSKGGGRGRPSKLYSLLKDWLGKSEWTEGEQFDPATLLGKYALLNLTVEKGEKRDFVKIASIGPPFLKDGTGKFAGKKVLAVSVEKRQHDPFAWEIGPGKELVRDDWLPWIFCGTGAEAFGHVSKHIERSKEWRELHPSSSGPPQWRTSTKMEPPPGQKQHPMTQDEVDAVLAMDDGTFCAPQEVSSEDDIPY